MALRPIERFLQLESASGIILFLMAILAIIWANSPLAFIHERFVSAFLFLINEGLMAIFFLAVGLELKRGILDGQLSRFSQVILPLVAALGGMIVPAIVYLLINAHDPATLRAWATPVATDIAFALGVLSLFGRNVPPALKIFLLALAIFDDIGAILIIGIFYSSGISYLFLTLSAVVVALLFLLNFFSVRSILSYLILGVILWFFMLRSGIHPTLAGVIVALAIPDSPHKEQPPLIRLENAIHPWVAYFIMPLFALANAGFSFDGLSFSGMATHLIAGIIAGLFIGKQMGVFGFSWLMIRLKIAKLPKGTSWLTLYGVSLLCGIGFTMSLFLGTLSFQNESTYLSEVRLGVLTGSILSGLAGAMILTVAFFKRANVQD